MIAQIAIGLMVFNVGILAGMYIAALMRANGRDDDRDIDKNIHELGVYGQTKT